MPGGQPTKYNKQIAERICMLVATHSFGLNTICKMYDDLPNPDTIYEWRHVHKEFSEKFAEAKLKQADLLAEEILEIADNASNDYMETLGDEEQGIGYKLNGEHVQRSRLRIDTRKWLASKLLPKQYGDKVQSETTVTFKHEDALKELE